MIDSVGTVPLWIAFLAVIGAMLFLDLSVLHRRSHAVAPKEAAITSAAWIGVALLFNGFVVWRFDASVGLEFLTGYVLEKALSVDNLFVIYAIFGAFAVRPEHQHRVLFWGILGAIIMRGAMVFAGAALLQRFHWIVLLFGAVLLISGARMLRRRHELQGPEESRAYRLLQRALPTTGLRDGKLLVREGGRLLATPLFIALIVIEASDVVFAVDSIFAIFAITADPFIVLTSNIFAVLGLRALYFLLAGMAVRFRYLQPGLALVLVFVGVKMVASVWVKLPVLASLGVIVLLLALSILASLLRERRSGSPSGGTSTPPPRG